MEIDRETNVGTSARSFFVIGIAAITIGVAIGAAILVSPTDASTAQILCSSSVSGIAEEEPFLSENDAVMKKMMRDMATEPTGNVDADFVAMMVPHHQGAIDMAMAILRHGRNPQIRRLAQEIIVTQQQEIAAMRLAVGEPLPPSVPSPVDAPALK